MSAYIYIEGAATGENSKNSKIKCQQAFHKLLDRMGFTGRKPRLVACGGRDDVYERFCIEHKTGKAEYVAVWIDAEEPTEDAEQAWTHLAQVTTVAAWKRPDGAIDEQILFMTTCMETWVVTDRATLRDHYGSRLQETALPPLVNLESRQRQDVQRNLEHATRDCTNTYAKGGRSFEVFGKLMPAPLAQHLPAFVRIQRILNERL